MTMTIAKTRSMITTMTIIAGFFAIAISAAASVTGLTQDESTASKTMKKTASGLEYVDEKEGTGETPKAGQTCLVHYTGWLWENNAKGKKFDSSRDRNAPFAFPVGEGRVIKGWDEGVGTMKVGGKASC